MLRVDLCPASPPLPLPFFAPNIFIRLSTINKATKSSFLCFLLQPLTPLCARALTASKGGLSHKKKPERCQSESHIDVLRSSWRLLVCFDIPGRRRRDFPRPGSGLFPTLWYSSWAQKSLPKSRTYKLLTLSWSSICWPTTKPSPLSSFLKAKLLSGQRFPQCTAMKSRIIWSSGDQLIRMVE